MRTREARRALVWAVVISAIVGVGVGWFARRWYRPSTEDRVRAEAGRIRGKIHELTH